MASLWAKERRGATVLIGFEVITGTCLPEVITYHTTKVGRFHSAVLS